MSDDVFRIVITVAVILAALAFVVQAIVVFALYRAMRKLQNRVEPLTDRARQTIEKVEPVIAKASPVIDQIGPVVAKIGPVLDEAKKAVAATTRILEDARPRVAEVSDEVVAIAREGREQAHRIGDLLTDAGDRARERLDQIDHTVETTVEQVEQVGENMKRAVMRPVREVNGIAAGISAAVATLVKKPRKSSVDSATQDEEMFI